MVLVNSEKNIYSAACKRKKLIFSFWKVCYSEAKIRVRKQNNNQQTVLLKTAKGEM